MTSQEFVCWLKGFTEGVHEYNITPKQWDRLKEVLSKVNDSPGYSVEIGVGGTGITNYITSHTGPELLND
jgi:molybdopterin biosynthesis enzyme MoaB